MIIPSSGENHISRVWSVADSLRKVALEIPDKYQAPVGASGWDNRRPYPWGVIPFVLFALVRSSVYLFFCCLFT